jgi:ABC-type antimicrobial peptide transport system permease subunit
MNLNFALKDIYRKRDQTYPYILMITIVIAFAVFMIAFTGSHGFDAIIQGNWGSGLFFSGSMSNLYFQFSNLILDMIFILAFIVVVVIATTLIANKKHDIAVMRALGTLPGSLHGFYLLEVVIIFIIGFILGLIFGIISFGSFALITTFFGFTVAFQFDLFYLFVLFTACFLGVIVVPGLSIIKMGKKSIIKSFSKDIPYDYNASKGLMFIPKWLSRIGFNLKMSVVNTIRRKGEFQRYLALFSIIFLIIFTLGLGTVVLGTSTREWIHKSQGDNIIAIGHQDTLNYYAQMYQMFSNPGIFIDESDINFTSSDYLFNISQLAELKSLAKIEQIDERLIHFCNITEKPYLKLISLPDPPYSDYEQIGMDRNGYYPIIGVNSSNIIQDFEMSGNFFTDQNFNDYMVVGEGLAFNFFETVFDQKILIETLNTTLSISGFAIDSFYCGYAGYIGLDVIQNELNLNSGEINLVLLKIKQGTYESIKNDITNTTNKLGANFTHTVLDGIYNANLNHVYSISQYPALLIVVLAVVGILSLYNYQKGGVMEKARDLLIMRSIGAKKKSLRRIINFEGLFVIIPSIMLSCAIGMIVNSVFLFDRVYLPPLYVPFAVVSLLFILSVIFNYLSLIPIIRKLRRFSIKDFDIF